MEASVAEIPPIQVTSLDRWCQRLKTREAAVGVIGLGYVGLPLALSFSNVGIRVVGFDIDSGKVDKLNRGESYIWHIAPEQIEAARSNRFIATVDFRSVRELDAVLICVPTPLASHYAPDLGFLKAALASLAPHLHSGQLVVLESTTYPGTTEELVTVAIEEAGHHVLRGEGEELSGIMVAFSPEREDPGNKATPRHDIPKMIGGCDSRARAAAAELYGNVFRQTVTVSSPATAEMTKLLENTYRAVNIALVNELKQLCLKMDIDIWEVIDAAATKPFGFQAFYPGPGIGGHCIPVDPFYLAWKAQEYGFSPRFIQLSGEINQAMPSFTVECVVKALNRLGRPISGSSVLVLGAAYKRDVDDLRGSPSLLIIGLLQRLGASVCYNDPYIPQIEAAYGVAGCLESVAIDDVSDFDCVLIATDHTVYDYGRIVNAAKLIVDARNATRGLVSANIVRC